MPRREKPGLSTRGMDLFVCPNHGGSDQDLLSLKEAKDMSPDLYKQIFFPLE